MKQIRLNTLQLSSIIFIQIAGTGLLIVPGTVVLIAGIDGWISIIISTLHALLLGMIVFFLYRYFPNDTLIGIFEKVTGKIIGKLLGVGFVIYCLVSLSTVIKQGCSITLNIFLPESKPINFYIAYFLIVVYILKMGITVLARTNVLITIFLLISFLTIILTAIPLLEIPLKPMMAEGMKPILKGSLSPSSLMNQVILISMIFPLFPKEENGNIKKIIIFSLLLVGVLSTILSVMTIGILGLETRDQYFPIYTIAKLIEIDYFWRRLDVLIMFAWVGGVTLKISFWFYCTLVAIKQLLNIPSYKPIVLPMTLLMFTLAFYATNNSTELAYYLGRVYPLFSLLSYELFIPVLIFIIMLVKKGVTTR